jgi:hypothetical protein
MTKVAISADKEHPFYSPDYMNYTVLFNDRPLNHCVTANCITGMATIYCCDKLGNVVVAPDGNAQKQEICGRIQIIRKQ